jgi:hypothetical protein
VLVGVAVGVDVGGIGVLVGVCAQAAQNGVASRNRATKRTAPLAVLARLPRDRSNDPSRFDYK